jgi:hypothetical protein
VQRVLGLSYDLEALRERALGVVRRQGLRLLATGLLAFLSVRAVLRASGGEPAVPLDDSFIHFQYARSFWEGRFFAYTPGAAPAAGATSLLWPALLAVPYALGLRAEKLIWAAWLFGFAALGLLGYETRRASERLLSRDGALGAELMVLTFGGHIWFAASGMEVVPLGWLLLRAARRSAEWAEGSDAGPRLRELVALAWLGPLLRPEGTLATLAVAATLLAFPRGARRLTALAALGGAFLPGLVNWLGTGTATTNTAVVKWLPLSPYLEGSGLVRAISDNVTLLFGTLLNGEVWSAVFLPEGFGLVFWLALPALFAAGVQRRARFRAALVVCVALGMLIPATYDTFLWNRLRYLWPFSAAWLIGVAALADGLGAFARRFGEGWERVRLLASGVVVGAFASHLPWTIDDLATSSSAINKQQAELGRWAARELPRGSVIGVNDTGAIAYFSGHRTFDVCGLTSAGEARYWAAGAGSRFEHYERIGQRALPSHFIVYPEWFALPALLGQFRTERRVSGATILGGESMQAFDAAYDALGTGALPRQAPTHFRLIDELDVADLESEASHGYALFTATSGENVTVTRDGLSDGGRRGRTRESFELEVASGGRLVARFEAEREMELSFRSGGAELGSVELEPNVLDEVVVPTGSTSGRLRLEVVSRNGPVTALHYWSYAPAARAP